MREILEADPSKLNELATAILANALTDARFCKIAIEYLDGKVPDVVHVTETTFHLLPPGQARGPYEVSDGSDDHSSTPPTDPPATPSAK